MARYIDADALLNELKEELEFDSPMYNEVENKWLNKGLRIAINDVKRFSTADVAPRAEVAREIIFDLACKLHTMLPHKIHPIPIDGKIECNTYELGQEHIIFNTLKYLGELEKKYLEGQK